MELSSLTPELPKLLTEMGVKYDPERLAAALSSRPAGALLEGSKQQAGLGQSSYLGSRALQPAVEAAAVCTTQPLKSGIQHHLRCLPDRLPACPPHAHAAAPDCVQTWRLGR